MVGIGRHDQLLPTIADHCRPLPTIADHYRPLRSVVVGNGRQWSAMVEPLSIWPALPIHTKLPQAVEGFLGLRRRNCGTGLRNRHSCTSPHRLFVLHTVKGLDKVQIREANLR